MLSFSVCRRDIIKNALNLCVALILLGNADALVPPSRHDSLGGAPTCTQSTTAAVTTSKTTTTTTMLGMGMPQDDNDAGETMQRKPTASFNDDRDETYIYDPANRLSPTKANYMDDLTPPPINLARDSILFGENPSTRSNSGGLKIWQGCKTKLPAVMTGAWPWRDPNVADDNPIGGLYNMAFVRLPVILVGVVYSKNLVEGHPLVVDFGHGPFVMNPLVVYAVLALILA